ncbi:NAD(+) kinase [Monosporozyma servazzii]
MNEHTCSSINTTKQKLQEFTTTGSGNSSTSDSTSSSPSLRKDAPGLQSSSNVHFQYASAASDVRRLNKDITNIMVDVNVKNLMIVTKLNDDSLYFLTRELTAWLLTKYPDMTIYVDKQLDGDEKFAVKDIIKECEANSNRSPCSHRVQYWTNKFIEQHDVFFDLVVTLGGDGTVMFVSSIFQKHVPPVLSFALGSLGFLTNFKFEAFQDSLNSVINHKVKTNLRFRLECKLFRRIETDELNEDGNKIVKMKLNGTFHVLNELTVDRGPSPFLSMLELYGNDSLMTVAQADGLIVATPTGSTAYSLSAGGSLLYPTVNAIAVTPICPHTLSFRPIILPDTIKLKIKVPVKSRNSAWVAFDGKNKMELQRGDYVSVSASQYWFPTVEARETEFIDSISRQLNWNAREQQKSFTHMLSEKNKANYESLQLKPTQQQVKKEPIEVEIEEE